MIHPFYLFKAPKTSTIIPCIQDLWYKLYTSLLITAFVTCLMLRALKTKRFADGVYRTQPVIMCSDQISDCQTVNMTIGYSFSSMER